jgi:hypothetical protein
MQQDNCYCVDTVAALKKEKKDFFLAKLQNEISSDGTQIPAAAAAGVSAKPPTRNANPPAINAKSPPNNAKPPASNAKPTPNNANPKRKDGDTEDKEPPIAKSKRRKLVDTEDEESSDGDDDDDEKDERKPEAKVTQTKIIVLSDSDSD